MLKVLFRYTGLIWDFLNGLVQPFFAFLDLSLLDVLIKLDLPTWTDATMAILIGVLTKHFPELLTTTVLELFFGYSIVIVLIVSLIKFFKELIF